jgi:hypothetical protein
MTPVGGTRMQLTAVLLLGLAALVGDAVEVEEAALLLAVQRELGQVVLHVLLVTVLLLLRPLLAWLGSAGKGTR